MQIIIGIGVLLLAYIIGSIPFGWLIVKLKTGQDIRVIESGRTGGTNAMRAAGFWAGLLTAIMDILKGAVAVWIAQALFPEAHFIQMVRDPRATVASLLQVGAQAAQKQVSAPPWTTSLRGAVHQVDQYLAAGFLATEQAPTKILTVYRII